MTSHLTIDKPTTLEEYTDWIRDYHNIEITYEHEEYYSSAVNQMEKQLIISPFWRLICNKLQEYNDTYMLDTGYQLLRDTSEPKIIKKPFLSFYDKTFRKNIIEDDNWPNEPVGGWILPDNWLLRINDILRTTIVVTYLDGVAHLTGELETLCEQNSKYTECKFQAREEGYYAAHLYFGEEFKIPTIDYWDTQIIKTFVEIQITTQVKEVIRDLLHKHYERRRSKLPTSELSWQWNYESDEFATNYLGHIIHYVEGMIVGIRKRENL